MSDEIDFSLALYTIMSPGLDPYLHEFINKHQYKHTKRGNDASQIIMFWLKKQNIFLRKLESER